MLIGSMVGNEIQDQLDFPRMRFPNQEIEVVQSAEQRMNPDVIRHIVAEVLHRRRIDRREPNRIDAEPAQIIEPCDQATQIAHAVAIAVHERAWVDLVDNAALPPQIGGGALTAASGVRSEFSRHCQSSGFVFSGSGTSSTAACPGMCQADRKSVV